MERTSNDCDRENAKRRRSDSMLTSLESERAGIYIPPPLSTVPGTSRANAVDKAATTQATTTNGGALPLERPQLAANLLTQEQFRALGMSPPFSNLPFPSSQVQTRTDNLTADVIQQLAWSRYVEGQIRDELRRRELLQAQLHLVAIAAQLSQQSSTATVPGESRTTEELMQQNANSDGKRRGEISNPTSSLQIQYPAVGYLPASGANANPGTKTTTALAGLVEHGTTHVATRTTTSNTAKLPPRAQSGGETSTAQALADPAAATTSGSGSRRRRRRSPCPPASAATAAPSVDTGDQGAKGGRGQERSKNSKLSEAAANWETRFDRAEQLHPVGNKQVSNGKRDPYIPMALETDRDVLTKYQCLIRDHVCYFAVTGDDLRRSAQGRNKPLTLGQVGVICKHCTHLRPSERARGATYFPSRLFGIYQAVQNIVTNHFLDSCVNIPPEIREEIGQMKKKRDTLWGGGRQYWIYSANVCGVIEKDKHLVFGSSNDATETPQQSVGK